MYVNAKADYAVRAAVELASSSRESPRKLDEIAAAQAIPVSYLVTIIMQLRDAGVVRSQRGSAGGYWLARPAEELDLGSVIRAVAGPLVAVRGMAPEEVTYVGSAVALQQVWLALHASLRSVLEHVTVADVATGELPSEMLALLSEDHAERTLP
jgi:Rrf2 family protein